MSMSFDDIAYEMAIEEEMKKKRENEGDTGIILFGNEQLFIIMNNAVVAQADSICTRKGCSLAEAIEKFIENIAETGEIPFELEYDDELVRQEAEAIIYDDKARTYNSAEELLEDLKSDD